MRTWVSVETWPWVEGVVMDEAESAKTSSDVLSALASDISVSLAAGATESYSKKCCPSVQKMSLSRPRISQSEKESTSQIANSL